MRWLIGIRITTQTQTIIKGARDLYEGMKILILDDEKYRHEGFDSVLDGNEVWHAYDGPQAVKILEELSPFDIVYLDYNLGQNGLTGAEVAAYIVRLPRAKRPKNVRIHSWHPDGAWRMQKILEGGEVPVINEPYGKAVVRLKHEKLS